MQHDFRKLNNIHIISATAQNEVVAEHAKDGIAFNIMPSVVIMPQLLTSSSVAKALKVSSIFR